MSLREDVKRSGQAAKIQLNPVEETLLMVLYLRVRDAASPNPLLGDIYAQHVINKVDCDFTRSIFTLDDRYVKYIAGRGRQIDVWCQDFVDRHDDQPVTVLHLACGLDSRNLRINRKSTVRWIDVDRPQVVSLRERLIETPPGDYRLVTADVVNEDDWLHNIPDDRPTMIIMEGLTMYLAPEKGFALFRKLLGHFHQGYLAFDTIGSVTVAFTSFLEAFRQSKAVIRWGMDDPKVIMALDPRLKLRDIVYLHDFMQTGPFGKNGVPLFGGWTPLVSLMPGFRKNGQFLLLEF
ncbi:tetracenomycin polyketide synthesis O-methyltransferase TcmP [Poronia punctata]|nr:tetracenomycin polyketide synthesis O-methyltransferase TcmP [Poronia punctata]